jgi:hypothetical protein
LDRIETRVGLRQILDDNFGKNVRDSDIDLMDNYFLEEDNNNNSHDNYDVGNSDVTKFILFAKTRAPSKLKQQREL